MEQTKRNPEGLVTEKPIALRLMPQELKDAERIAAELHLTKACLARKAFLAGLPLVSTAAAGNPPTAADFSDGEAPSSPSALSSLAA